MDSTKTWVGLTHADVEARTLAGLSNAQPNNLTKATKDIIFDNVFTVFNLLNVVIALALLLVQAYLNMFFIAVVLLNTVIGIVQEIRAKKALEKLSLLASKAVMVHRDGAWTPVHMEQLVIDDIFQLQSGDQIMSDSQVVEGQVEVNEALLTGEADPLNKIVGDSLLSGSFIVSGQCIAKVEKVGMENYATKISVEAKAHKKLHSDLLHSINTIVAFTSYFILPFGVLLFFNTYVLSDTPLRESVISTSAALLGMLPKGLVLLTTVALVIAVLKLTLKKILVQELYCIEMLARVDTICFDKTGTLTQGTMVVQDVYELSTFPQPLALLL
ncbi:MAG: HAD-IC family P-type ATPase, partial [Erysipelotrichaceae bacterium]